MQVLLLCLLGLLKLGNALTPLYHHPVYNLPVYSSSDKVTPYWGGRGNVFTGFGYHFLAEFCEVHHRPMANLFKAFDTNGDGRVTFNEVSTASLCNVLAVDEKCDWVFVLYKDDVGTPGGHVALREDYNDHAEFVRGRLVKIVFNMFNKFDSSNDNVLFMDEFFLFGDALFTAELFYRKATRDNRNLDVDAAGHEEIDQNEWNCKPDADGKYWNGTDGAECNLSNYDLTHFGGETMDLDEFSDWFNGAHKDAHKSSYWDGYCKNYVTTW